MKFVKGKSANKRGRPKGAQNKNTLEFKTALNDLLLDSSHKIQGWLDEAAKKDPARALDLFGKLAEYIYPKLSRNEAVIQSNVMIHNTPQDIELFGDLVKKVAADQSKNIAQKG
jgi:hypothetical protein